MRLDEGLNLEEGLDLGREAVGHQVELAIRRHKGDHTVGLHGIRTRTER